MKKPLCLLALVLAACETAPPPRSTGSSGAASARYRAAPASTATPSTVTAGSTAVSGALPPPDAQLLYQESARDAFGTTTYSSATQVRGPVVEEVHIGNQRVYSNQPVYAPPTIDGVVQAGYVPAGTTRVIDPMTGRSVPVRRR
jgi:hypothetical protein